MTEVLRSGRVNTWTGGETKAFEEEFASFCGCSYAIALANGSLALSSAYLSLGLGSGDELITTPRTFIATASSAVLLVLVQFSLMSMKILVRSPQIRLHL